jgi:hypothetical protein
MDDQLKKAHAPGVHFRHAGFLALHVQDAFVLAERQSTTGRCHIAYASFRCGTATGINRCLGYCKIKTRGAGSAATMFLFEVNLAPKGLSRQGFMSRLRCRNDSFR